MAKKKTEQEKAEPEKTIGKGEAQAASNGAPPEAAMPEEAATEDIGAEDAAQEEVIDKTDEIAATYERAKKELTEAVSKLRDEIKQIDVEKARQQARTWVEENPTLTVFLALGAGIVVGKLIAEALKPAPPPPLSRRLKSQGRELASQASHYAHDVSDVVADRAAEVGEAIVRRARELGDDVTRRARELGEDVTRRATEAVSATSERAADWGEAVSERSGRAAHAVHDTAEELAGTAKARAGHGLDVFESLFNTIKSITAALIVQKVTDWLRRAR
ncbi:MAG: hypothetical protein IH820_12750 [Bacteroidetes bacterium]|nr:hypothetical protein [Bacteroidota bacterium]